MGLPPLVGKDSERNFYDDDDDDDDDGDSTMDDGSSYLRRLLFAGVRLITGPVSRRR